MKTQGKNTDKTIGFAICLQPESSSGNVLKEIDGKIYQINFFLSDMKNALALCKRNQRVGKFRLGASANPTMADATFIEWVKKGPPSLFNKECEAMDKKISEKSFGGQGGDSTRGTC